MVIWVTRRLCLRPWRQQDLPALQRILMDPQTMAHWPQPYDHAGVQAWLDRAQANMREVGFARWCCQRRSDAQIVGDVGVMPLQIRGALRNDLGYIIHRDYWRQGYALEAAEGVVQWAREHRLSELVATMATDNHASAGVARKLGMQLEETFNNPNNADKETFYFRLALV